MICKCFLPRSVLLCFTFSVPLMRHQNKNKNVHYLYHCFYSFSCSARFLWKRIPLHIKSGNIELETIHSIYICLWNNDITGFFKTINYEWSNNIAELMFELRGKYGNSCKEPIFLHCFVLYRKGILHLFCY